MSETGGPRPAGRRLRAGAARWFALLAPLLMLGVVAGIELANKQWTVLELAVLSPMLAATYAGPRLTALYGVLAVATGVALGFYDDLFGQADGGATAQAVRLSGVTCGAIMALLVSRYNTSRETKLENVTRVADVAQQTILTAVPPVSGGLRLAVRYESAAAEAMVGGDLYEVIDSPWGTRLLIGDVRGKGLDAVRIASRVLSGFRITGRRTPGLAGILADLDAEVGEVSGLDDFVTAVIVQIDGDHLTIANAGHPDPILLRDGVARLLPTSRRLPPLGLFGDGDNTTPAQLAPGDRLLLYTDGIIEARHPTTGAFFPILPAAEEAFRAVSLDGALTDLVIRVQEWTQAALNDDVALLAAELPAPVTPGPAPAAELPATATGG